MENLSHFQSACILLYMSNVNILNVILIHVRYLSERVLGNFMVTCNTAQIYHEIFDMFPSPCVVVSLKYFPWKIGKLVKINFASPARCNHTSEFIFIFSLTWHRINALSCPIAAEGSKKNYVCVCVTCIGRKDKILLAKDQEMSLDYYVGNDDDDKKYHHCALSCSDSTSSLIHSWMHLGEFL